MANMCWNEMTVEGDPEVVKSFLDSLEKEDDYILKVEDEEGGDTIPISIEDDNEPGRAYLTYETNWSPPSTESYLNLTKSFPGMKITTSYDECGSEIMGCGIYLDGKVLHKEDYSDDQYLDGTEQVQNAMGMTIEDAIRDIVMYNPDGPRGDDEKLCRTAYNILLARIEGDEITKENFPQIFMEGL